MSTNRNTVSTQVGINSPSCPALNKGHHCKLPDMPPAIPWLMFLAFEHFLPRWQAARR